MMESQGYRVTLKGLTPLLMHDFNFMFDEVVEEWRKNPANKDKKKPGDDRVPGWRWLGYAYHHDGVLGIPSDNLMTMLREAGTKVIAKGKLTFKFQTQYGIVIDSAQWDVTNHGETIDFGALYDELIGNENFMENVRAVKKAGFELWPKGVTVGKAKHIRVRPRFDDWAAVGNLTVLDESENGLTEKILRMILEIGGTRCGIGDFRPSSKSSGKFGKFSVDLEKL